MLNFMVLLRKLDTLTHVLNESNLGRSTLPLICNYCEVNGWRKLFAKRYYTFICWELILAIE